MRYCFRAAEYFFFNVTTIPFQKIGLYEIILVTWDRNVEQDLYPRIYLSVSTKGVVQFEGPSHCSSGCGIGTFTVNAKNVMTVECTAKSDGMGLFVAKMLF